MSVKAFCAAVLVICATMLQVTPQVAQPVESIDDLDAYDVYAAVLPGVWTTVSKETLILQRETEGFDAVAVCLYATPTVDPEWQEVERNFRQGNTRVRLLREILPVTIAYQMISRSEIAAGDARLALKYPGNWQRRPESMEYTAVSAVGFDSQKTKAIVYVRLRSTGLLHALELRDGKWIPARRSRGCGPWSS